jgi:hypothetical protein
MKNYKTALTAIYLGVATAAAVIYGVCSYVWLAAQLFWEEHGETISVAAIRAVFLTADFAGELLQAGRDFRRFCDRYTAVLADTTFYTLAQI